MLNKDEKAAVATVRCRWCDAVNIVLMDNTGKVDKMSLPCDCAEKRKKDLWFKETQKAEKSDVA